VLLVGARQKTAVKGMAWVTPQESDHYINATTADDQGRGETSPKNMLCMVIGKDGVPGGDTKGRGKGKDALHRGQFQPATNYRMISVTEWEDGGSRSAAEK